MKKNETSLKCRAEVNSHQQEMIFRGSQALQLPADFTEISGKELSEIKGGEGLTYWITAVLGFFHVNSKPGSGQSSGQQLMNAALG